MLGEQGDATDDTLLRVYSGRNGAVVKLPEDATQVDARLWGSILALAAEELAREYAARGRVQERTVLTQIIRCFGAEVAAMLDTRQLKH